MTNGAPNFATTYTYEGLQSPRHIRLLELSKNDGADEDDVPVVYSLVQVELPSGDAVLDFEALSYTWGDPSRVSGLHLHGHPGLIGLTASLTEALPHVTKHSKTKRLWVDQLCINQIDTEERSIQVGLMAEIYQRATQVIIWLDPEDESSRICKQWLDAINKLLPTLPTANKLVIGSPEYSHNWRLLVVGDTFNSPDTDAIYAANIGKFWGRRWFRRGWVVQEKLLAREILCLTGDITFGLQDLVDLFTVPASDALMDATDGSLAYRIMMQLKTDPFTDTPQPLRFLRTMAAGAQEFETQELGDRLYGFLGMIKGLDFVPNYQTPVRDNFTRFAATLARQYGSLDFLSMWSANLDEMLKGTPPELLGLPSWVPSFSSIPLLAPWRLAIAGARSWGTTIKWNAASGRKHIHDQPYDAAATKRLQVRGRIVDHIHTMSSARIAKFFDVTEEELTGHCEQIKKDLTGFDHWTQTELVDFLNVVACNGDAPRETGAQILDLTPSGFLNEHKYLNKRTEALGISLTMGRGRRFMKTEEGRVGLAPFIGTRPREGENNGSVIVVLHGCIVPMVLQRADGSGEEEGGEWKVIGDCYVEGIMFGEAMTWDEDDARTFVLV